MRNNITCKADVSLECYNYYRALTKGDKSMANNKERERLQKLYGSLYKRHFITEGYKCFYCGETAQCLDHVPALTTLETLPKGYMKKNNIPYSLLTCCFECNKALGDRNIIHVLDRLLYLESYYEALLKKQKSKWDEEELAEMGENMQKFIRHKQERLDIYVQKIRAIQLRQLKSETYPCSEIG